VYGRDAWYSQHGITRTEAKRRYITTLVDTMHRYASQTEEARELVAELEFVWDQIKYSTSSSSSSSPMQAMGLPPTAEVSSAPPPPRRYGSIDGRMSRSPPVMAEEDPDEDLAIYRRRLGDSRLRVLSPVSQSDVQNSNIPEEEDDDEDDEEFQEARDGASSEETTSQERNQRPAAAKSRRRRASTPGDRGGGVSAHNDWRRRVEQALTTMTTELAALREQIESRPIYSRRKSSLWSWLKWLFWIATRQLLWDCVVLGIVLVWMRIKGDRRLEQKVRAGVVSLTRQLMSLRLPRRLPSLSLP
jgi:hypothetical protein